MMESGMVETQVNIKYILEVGWVFEIRFRKIIQSMMLSGHLINLLLSLLLSFN